MKNVAIVETGVANTASVQAAFQRLDTIVTITTDPRTIEQNEFVVLPGVGSFAAGMNSLKEKKLIDPLKQRIKSGRPLLAICLGLQLLFEGSEENSDVQGLGLLPGVVSKVDTKLPLPHLSWSQISGFANGWGYFAHSFAATDVPSDFQPLKANYGTSFIAGFKRDGLLACQFHPELSGRFGLSLLKEWLR